DSVRIGVEDGFQKSTRIFGELLRRVPAEQDLLHPELIDMLHGDPITTGLRDSGGFVRFSEASTQPCKAEIRSPDPGGNLHVLVFSSDGEQSATHTSDKFRSLAGCRFPIGEPPEGPPVCTLDDGSIDTVARER